MHEIVIEDLNKKSFLLINDTIPQLVKGMYLDKSSDLYDIYLGNFINCTITVGVNHISFYAGDNAVFLGRGDYTKVLIQ